MGRNPDNATFSLGMVLCKASASHLAQQDNHGYLWASMLCCPIVPIHLRMCHVVMKQCNEQPQTSEAFCAPGKIWVWCGTGYLVAQGLKAKRLMEF